MENLTTNNETIKKADRISKERYNELKNSEAERLASAYVMSCISKGKAKLDQANKDFQSGKLHKMFISKAVSNLAERGFLEKGVRGGHINHAPVEIQSAYEEAKKLIAGKSFSYDGCEYVISVLVKKVVESK